LKLLKSHDSLSIITQEFEDLIKGNPKDKTGSIEKMMKITAEAAVEGSKLVAGLSNDEAHV
jgi:hypothetical protein